MESRKRRYYDNGDDNNDTGAHMIDWINPGEDIIQARLIGRQDCALETQELESRLADATAELESVLQQLADAEKPLLNRIAQLEGDRALDREYNERVPDPRQHKYLDPECCTNGCKGLLVKQQAAALVAMANEIESLRKTRNA